MNKPPLKKVLATSLSAVLIALAMTAPVQAQAVAPEKADVGGPIPERSLTAQWMFQILAAEVAAQRGQYGAAARTYLDLARETRDPRLAQRATELALVTRSLEQSLPAAQLWFELAPASAAAAQTVEAIWLSSGKLADAEPLLAKRLVQARKEGKVAGVYQQLLRMLPSMNDRKAALGLMQRLSREDSSVAEARLAVAQAAMAADEPDKAMPEARAAVKLAPRQDEIVISAARVLGSTPATIDEAIGWLEGVIQRQSKSLDAYFTLGRLQLQKGRLPQARQTFEAALALEPQNPSLIMALAQIAFQARQFDDAQRLVDRLIALPADIQRDNDVAYLFAGQIAEERKDAAAALAWYAKVRPGEQFTVALSRRALLMARSGQIEQGRALLRGAEAAAARDRIMLITTEAQMLREARRHEDGFKVLDEALKKAPDTPELLYDHALAAERVGKTDLMEQSLRRLIALRPEAAHAYNALGYSLADRNLRLPEARDLIAKALELRPDDPHIMDSMGWVLFRQGENDKARDYLEKALRISPEIDIVVHLAEVLWVQGRRDEALKLWRDAVQREPDNETLKETLGRLKVVL